MENWFNLVFSEAPFSGIISHATSCQKGIIARNTTQQNTQIFEHTLGHAWVMRWLTLKKWHIN